VQNLFRAKEKQKSNEEKSQESEKEPKEAKKGI
jgi:hypothetical protein